MNKYFFMFVFCFTSSCFALPIVNCNSRLSTDITKQVSHMIRKICDVDDLSDACFMIDNSTINKNYCSIESGAFFIINQAKNLVLMPYEMYKKLLLVLNTSYYWDKNDFIKNSELQNSTEITWLLDECNAYSYLISNPVSGVNAAFKQKSSQIDYVFIISLTLIFSAICFSTLAAGYSVRSYKETRKQKNYSIID